MTVATQVKPVAMEKWFSGVMPSVSRLAAKALAVVVTSEAEYEYAAACLQEAKARAASIEAERVDFVKPLNDTVKKINNHARRPAEMLKEAITWVDAKMRDYRLQEQARAAAEQRRLDEEAAKEQAKLQTRADAKADKAEARGDLDKAQAIRDAVPEVVAVQVAAKIPEVEGMHTRTVWKFEVMDLPVLMKGVLAGKVPAEAVLANEAFIGKEARDKKEELKWPGVRVYSEETLVNAGR